MRVRRPASAWTRLPYAAAVAGTVAAGLVVYLRGQGLPAALRDVLGDALWAAMIAWLVGMVAPGRSLRGRSAAALAVCAAVELSQGYHTPSLDALRATRAGHLVLGSAFDPRDLAAYALGVCAAAFAEWRARRARSGPGRTRG